MDLLSIQEGRKQLRVAIAWGCSFYEAPYRDGVRRIQAESQSQ